MKRPATGTGPFPGRLILPAAFTRAAAFAYLVAVAFLTGCNAPPGGGTDVGNPETVSGSLRRVDGEPAPWVRVQLRPRGFLSNPESLMAAVPPEHAIQDRKTDTQGFFQFDSVPKGDYCIQAFDSSSHGARVLFSVDGTGGRIMLEPAIMDTTGSISGTINYLGPDRPGFPKVIIAVFGMDRWTVANDAGEFILSDLPSGKYVLRISTPTNAALIATVPETMLTSGRQSLRGIGGSGALMAGKAPLAQLRMGLLAVALSAVFCVSAFSSPASTAPVPPAPGPYPVGIMPSGYLPVSTMYRGATFYGTGRPVSVHFVHSMADWGNQLFLMDFKTGAEQPLMIYRRIGRGNLCPDSGGVRADLGVYDSAQELVFMLRTVSSNEYAGRYCTGEACGPRYTGLNHPAKSRFYSSGEFSHMAGFLWAEAARITAKQADSLPPPCFGAPPVAGEEGVLISFNDGANDSFGDLVIQVIGVQMDVERNGGGIAIPPDTLGNKPNPVFCGIDAKAGGVTRGESFRPQAMDKPVSAIVPRHRPTQPRIYMDQAWRTSDARRPDETHFPNGPEIRINAPGPFEFNLGFYTNQGGFVNRARGQVTAEMLRDLEAGIDGRRAISLMWYPASAGGQMASTGAYVVRGWFRTLPKAKPLGPGHPASSCPEARFNLLSTFGFIRR